jgi:competence protein ComEC
LGNKSALSCTVLKVPHHGSRTSTSEAFLESASPACALIGAGYGNRFRLPSRETLSRLGKRKVAVYRTDLDGTVSITYAHGKWTVDTYRNDRHFH